MSDTPLVPAYTSRASDAVPHCECGQVGITVWRGGLITAVICPEHGILDHDAIIWEVQP